MADLLVEDTVDQAADDRHTIWGPYWVNPEIAVITFVDPGDDLMYTRTTDGGRTWGPEVEIKNGFIINASCWFDKETPGDTGTLLHILYLDDTSDIAYYRTLDVSTDTLGTERTIASGLTINNQSDQQRSAITKTLNGNILVAFVTSAERECKRSTDGGVGWTDRADVYETVSTPHHAMLFPANTGDGADACAIYNDRDIFDRKLVIKMYDDSANSWSEFATKIGLINVNSFSFDGSVRHSDNHVLVAFHTQANNSTDDLSTADLTVDSISAPGISPKTDIFTNQAAAERVAVFIDQGTDNVYAAYLKGGTWTSAMDVVFHKSTDGMSTWGAEEAYSEAAADDLRRVTAGRTIDSSSDGLYLPAWWNDDLTDIFVSGTRCNT